MGLKFDANFDQKLELRLRQMGDEAVKGVVDVMREGAEEIQQLAREMAPYASPKYGGSPDDRKHLQDAIEVKEFKDGRRKGFAVFVNGRRRGNKGKTIAQYAMLMHEFLEPYGDVPVYHASPSTQAKGAQAGGKFLERAYRELYKKILNDATTRARRAFQRSRR